MSLPVHDGHSDISLRVPLSWYKWTLAKHAVYLLTFAAVVAGFINAAYGESFVRIYDDAVLIALVLLLPAGLMSRQFLVVRNGSIRVGSWARFARSRPTYLVRSVEVVETRHGTIIATPADLLTVRCLKMQIAFYDGTSAYLIGDVSPVVRAGMADLGDKLSQALDVDFHQRSEELVFPIPDEPLSADSGQLQRWIDREAPPLVFDLKIPFRYWYSRETLEKEWAVCMPKFALRDHADVDPSEPASETIPEWATLPWHHDDRRMMTTDTLWLIQNLSRSYGECLRHAVPGADWILQPRNDSEAVGDIALVIRDRRVDIGYHSATFPVWDIVTLVRQILSGDSRSVSITETFDLRVAELLRGLYRRGF